MGAFVLSNHSSHSPAFFKYPPPDLQTNEGPTACVKQVANYTLPSILLNQDEKIASARNSAADGYLSSYTIPLLVCCAGSVALRPAASTTRRVLVSVVWFCDPLLHQYNGHGRQGSDSFFLRGSRRQSLKLSSKRLSSTEFFSSSKLSLHPAFLGHSLTQSRARTPQARGCPLCYLLCT